MTSTQEFFDTLESRVDDLKDIIFHAKLGTQLERVQRIEGLVGEIAKIIGADVEKSKRAAGLCKADLTTGAAIGIAVRAGGDDGPAGRVRLTLGDPAGNLAGGPPMVAAGRDPYAPAMPNQDKLVEGVRDASCRGGSDLPAVRSL